MKVEIEFNIHCDDSKQVYDALSQTGETLADCVDKIAAQLSRPPALCDAPEGADLLYDVNGNRIGTIKVTL